MNRRRLGRTGLDVSCLAVGTVELGMDYGIPVPDDFGRPSQADAIGLLHLAVDSGVNLFDTAPSYGSSEELLGVALARRNDCYFATKVNVPQRDGKPLTGRALRQAIDGSLNRSRRSLCRDVLDIVQIHNATVEIIEHGAIAAALEAARARGEVRYLGASVYGEDAALAAIRSGCFDVIQVAYNLIDQRMRSRIFPAARAANIGVIARSPLLKGALSRKSQWLPQRLQALRETVDRAREELSVSWEDLSRTAIRFCLSATGVAAVLFGPRTAQELQTAVDAVSCGPLDDETCERSAQLASEDSELLNPSQWALP